MSERKVLNKYYPPDFDPSKIPRLRLPKNRQYTVRIMTPCNMRCNTCGDYISKAKKFNARKETVEDSNYLGLKIFRFYFKCPTCMAEITFKTDPKTCDYELEHGATRNFQALRLAEQQAEREAKEKEEDEKLNPMKMLENRTKASRKEMEELEALEELRDLSKRELNINHDEIIARKQRDAHTEQLMQQLEVIKEKLNEEEEDELLLKDMLAKQERIFGNEVNSDEDDDSDDEMKMKKRERFFQKKVIATDLLAPNSSSSSSATISSQEEEKKPTLKRKFDSLVKVKAKNINSNQTELQNPVKKINCDQNSLALLSAYSDSDSDSQS